jgi:hypothetical protein
VTQLFSSRGGLCYVDLEMQSLSVRHILRSMKPVHACRTRGLVCRLQWLLVLASAVILRSKSLWTRDQILLPRIQDSPNLQDQVLVFISPRTRVARLYPRARGSLFVASYDSQGYGGGIRHASTRHVYFPFTTY